MPIDEQKHEERYEEESHRLATGMVLLGLERPVSVPEEVVRRGDHGGEHERQLVGRLERVNEDEEADEVDDVPRCADAEEPHQLLVVLRVADLVGEAPVGATQSAQCPSGGRKLEHGGHFVRHSSQSYLQKLCFGAS